MYRESRIVLLDPNTCQMFHYSILFQLGQLDFETLSDITSPQGLIHSLGTLLKARDAKYSCLRIHTMLAYCNQNA